MRHVSLKLLLLIIGVAASIWGLYFYREVVNTWFLSAQEFLTIIARAYVFRAISRPFARWPTRIFIAWLPGYVAYGVFKTWSYRHFAEACNRTTSAWNAMPVWVRVAVAMIACILILTSDYVLYLLAFLLPCGKVIVRGLHFWGLDVPYDRWVQPLRQRLRGILRAYMIFRIIRWPHRTLLYFLLKRAETEREQKWWHLLANRLSKIRKHN